MHSHVPKHSSLSAHLIIINKDAKPLLTGTFRDFYLHDFVANIINKDAKPLLTGTFRDFYLHDFVAKLSSRA